MTTHATETIAALEIAVKQACDLGFDRSDINRIVARAIANIQCGHAERCGQALGLNRGGF